MDFLQDLASRDFTLLRVRGVEGAIEHGIEILVERPGPEFAAKHLTPQPGRCYPWNNPEISPCTYQSWDP